MGSSPKVLTSRLRSAAQGLCQLSALRGEGLWEHVHPGRWGVLPVEMRLFPGCDSSARVDSVLRFTPGKE